MTQIQGFAIGPNSGALDTLASLGIPDPMPHFQPATEAATAQSGAQILRGFPLLVWEWGEITNAQRDDLRDYITDASNVVCVSTRTTENSDEFLTFDCIGVWPFPEPQDAGDTHHRLNFEIAFRMLVQVVSP